jgi:hypothetical protein
VDAIILAPPVARARRASHESPAEHIERMAAHATNIAEMAIYTTSAQDVRHVT